MNDLQIEQSAKLLPIVEVAKKLDIEDLEQYGKYKAKVSPLNDRKKYGKLILVTAISPTKFGEGKTTVSIGLADGLAKIGKNVCLALREPSLGPVFGIKGGAAGGGYAQVSPMLDINLHFTGDFHAITSANNLLASAIDNHLNHGNQLGIDPLKIIYKRCLDLNDRALRDIIVGLGGIKDGVIRRDGFTITAASEIMATLCLAENLEDLKQRLGSILIGYTFNDKPVFCRDLKVENAMTILLKEAMKPNLVQTLENNPAFVHGGPFANIAHGCNTIVATQTAMTLADYTVTEAGFGADLGAEKFLDIKCRKANIFPNAVVLVASIRALKYNSCMDIDFSKKNIEALEKGSENLIRHIRNLRDVFGVKVVVALNKFTLDTDAEIKVVERIAKENGADFCVADVWAKGGEGAIELAKIVAKATENEVKPRFAYDVNDSIKDKINAICTKIYHAKDVAYSPQALDAIEKLEKNNLDKMPICIGKTQYSFTDDGTVLGAPSDYTFHIRDVYVRAGAGFIVAVAGQMMLMPGLAAKPNFEKMTITNDGKVDGVF
ncbi:MAG: formate--tetrahydrofolate ligase [Christensenellales bacterium]|jgi:formate--tetrahydrofolate ligase